MDTKAKFRQVPPRPSPPLPGWASATSRRKATSSSSITMEEIRRFWIQRKMKEEEHLLAAEKAAARITARVLTQQHYERFEASLKSIAEDDGKEGKENKDGEGLRIGIKDWWTKSRYAYLNQPAAVKDTDTCRACNTYDPNPNFVLGVF